MLMVKTEYTVQDLRIYKDGKVQAYGFMDMDSALHAVFCMEGKKQGTFFVESEGIVYLQEKVS